MIDAYLHVVRGIPYARCRPLIGRLLAGAPLSEALAAEPISEREFSLFARFSAESRTEAVQLGQDLEALYLALGGSEGPQIVWTGPMLQSKFVRSTFSVARTLVSTAESDLMIAGYLAHPAILETLGIRSALGRRARVSILLDRVDWDDLGVRALSAGGAEFLEATPRSTGIAKFHVKAIVADGTRALVGSANFTHLGQKDNVELGLLVGGDAARNVAGILYAYAESLRAAAGKRLDPK